MDSSNLIDKKVTHFLKTLPTSTGMGVTVHIHFEIVVVDKMQLNKKKRTNERTKKNIYKRKIKGIIKITKKK